MRKKFYLARILQKEFCIAPFKSIFTESFYQVRQELASIGHLSSPQIDGPFPIDYHLKSAMARGKLNRGKLNMKEAS